jgi:hypothetical protein
VAKGEELRWYVYPQDLPPGLSDARLPGRLLERLLYERGKSLKAHGLITAKLEHCCRKICNMCYAGERSKDAEREFYSSTIQESPGLWGEDAIILSYHLEAFVYFARSSLDLAATIFALLLLDKKMDSFNDLTKKLAKLHKSGDPGRLDKAFLFWVASERDNEKGWLRVLCGEERGRSLRDKIAHQTGFPIDYQEFSLLSEKAHAVVRLSRDTTLPLLDFLEAVRDGVIENFIRFETEAVRVCNGAPVEEQATTPT